MIISKTPYRISFFGGGTDYPYWYKKNKGLVIGTSIAVLLFLARNHFALKLDYQELL